MPDIRTDEKSAAEKTQPARSTVAQPRSPGMRWLLRVGGQCLGLLLTFMLGIFLIGSAQRLGWIRGGDSAVHAVGSGADAKQMEERPAAPPGEPAQYICPMMCTPPQADPGRCPVCAMKLVQAPTQGSAGGRNVVIDAAARRILGIRTADVKREAVFRKIRAVGEIEFDEERVAIIAAYADGRLEELFAEYVGVEVAQGDALAVLYSPQLYSAQVEYLSSLQTPNLNAVAGDYDRLSNVARDNLSELGMTARQIESLRSTGEAQKRLRIASPIGGTVIAKHKVEGDYVQTGEPIYRVADLSTVWLMLDLYPSDAATVRFGQQVEAEVQSLPGEVYTGRIAFVEPFVDERKRTVSVRVEMTNFDGRLKPGDYATATVRVPAIPRQQFYDPALAGKWISPRHPQIIRSESGQCPLCGVALVPTSEFGYSDEPVPEQSSLTVPRSALLMAGDNSVVYVETEPGEFEMRQVAIAALTDDAAVIQGGLNVGEAVATDGNFLIDSQMQLAGKPSLLDPAKGGGGQDPPQETAHAH